MVRGWREHLSTPTGASTSTRSTTSPSVGHAHPRLVEARRRAVAAAQHQLALPLRRWSSSSPSGSQPSLPDPLDTVFLSTAGSEAVDLALRLALAWRAGATCSRCTRRTTAGPYLTDAVSTSIADNPRALETRPDVGAHRSPRRTPTAARTAAPTPTGRYVAAVARSTGWPPTGTPVGRLHRRDRLRQRRRRRAARRLSRRGLRARCAQHGGLCIADEVQVGYGRLGEYFWGFEQQGVVPDIITIAKAMGNGHPLGAVITTRGDRGALSRGRATSSPPPAAARSVERRRTTVLDIIRDEQLQENAREVGDHLKARLEELGRAPPAPWRRARHGPLPRPRVRARPRDAGARDRRDGRDLRRACASWA